MPVLNIDVGGKWHWDGVIARIATRRVADLVRKLQLPTVDIMGVTKMRNVAVVDADHRRIVELAVDHLRLNGLKHLAFCGVPGLTFSDRREQIFIAYVGAAEHPPHVYAAPPRRRRLTDGMEQRVMIDHKPLQTWLESLPKPVGIVACNDTRARRVIEVCMTANIHVPREVALVGVDNDDVICELCTPALSSVEPNAETIGFEAARLLGNMMDGQPTPTQPRLIAPLGIEKRGSSDTEAFDHDDLNEAIRFIRENCDHNINVNAVVRHVGKSRSTLERRFRDHLDCTVHDFIHRHRIERIKNLLLETNFPASYIAQLMGFSSNTYFAAVFRKHVGMTPGAYRREHAPKN